MFNLGMTMESFFFLKKIIRMIDFGGYFDKCELYFGALIKKNQLEYVIISLYWFFNMR